MGPDCSHHTHHQDICGCCHQSPCCCHGLFLGAAKKTLRLGLGALNALQSACQHDSRHACCIPAGTDIIVHTLPGEVRIVPYQIKNDTQCPITVRPDVKPWTRCGCEDKVDARPAVLQSSGPWEIPACGSVNFDILIDTAGMKPCQCYCATLNLPGCACEPVQIAVCVGGKIPAVCHHDTSRLRAWVRTYCFSGKGPRYVAPPAMTNCNHDCD